MIKQNVDRAKTDLDEVYAAGRQAEWSDFWDDFQENGNRADYAYYVFGKGWTDDTYKPKYPIKPRNSYAMYSYSNMTEVLDVDTSNSTNISSLFSYCVALKRVGIIDARQGGNLGSVFYNCSALQTIDKLILAVTNGFNSVFNNCHALENLTIEGTIGQNGFNVQWSTKLSKASIISIINALSTTTSGLTVTLSKTAVENAFTTEEWDALIATKTNWTIALA